MKKKKYKKQLILSLKALEKSEYSLLKTMTNLMIMNELKKDKISFRKGDTFSFEDNIFNYSTDKNIQKLAKLRKSMLKTMRVIVDQNKFTDKEIEFLA